MLYLALHGQQSVTFPMDIGELGDDITRDGRMQTHRADFIMQTARHVRLRVFRKLGI